MDRGGGKVFVNQALTWRPVVFVGLISYSLYLWHWPLISFAKVAFPEVSLVSMVGVICFSIFISIVVYYFVENPIRRLTGRKRNFWTIVLLAVLVLIFFLGQGVRKADGLRDRPLSILQPAALRYFDHHHDWAYGDAPGHMVDSKYPEVNAFRLYAENVAPNMIFVGDSHMEQYSVRVLEVMNKKKDRPLFLTKGSCLAVPGLREEDGALSACSKIADAYLEELRSGNVEVFVISQIWGSYQRNFKRSFSTATGDKKLSHGGFTEALNYLATLPKRNPHVRFVVILDNPWDTSAKYDMCNVVNRWKKDLSEGDFVVSIPEDISWKKGNDEVKKILGSAGYQVIDPTAEICPKNKCSLLNYKDQNHLRASYVREHAVWIDRIFE